jgi:flagellar hook-associated protein 3 FlgL
MRVDPFYVSNLVGALDQAQFTEQQLSGELSSGVRVTSIGQDPVAAGQNALLLDQIQNDDSFTRSSSLVQGRLQVADSALGGVVSQLTQAITLATSANNGTLNPSQLQAISNQLSGIRDEVSSLANSTYEGQYIFAGSLAGTAPFSTSNSTVPAMTTYNGDGGVNYFETPNGQSIQLNLPGDQIFTAGGSNNVFQALNNLIADFSNGTGSPSSAADLQALNTALGYVSQQRVTLDNSLTRLTAATNSAASEKTQLMTAQTTLMQADLGEISTQLSLSKTQQTALEAVIAQLGSGTLFDKLS